MDETEMREAKFLYHTLIHTHHLKKLGCRKKYRLTAVSERYIGTRVQLNT